MFQGLITLSIRKLFLTSHLNFLLAHGQLAVDQHPQVLFCQTSLHCVGLLRPWCSTQCLALPKAVQLDMAHWTSLSRSLCRAFLHSSRSTCPPNLVSAAGLLRGHCIPSSRVLIKMLNKARPNPEPLWTPLVTGCQPDWNLFTMTLSPTIQTDFRPANSISNPSYEQPVSPGRNLWGTESNASLKPMETTLSRYTICLKDLGLYTLDESTSLLMTWNKTQEIFLYPTYT